MLCYLKKSSFKHSFTWLLNETYQPSLIYERNRCAYNVHVLAVAW